MAFSITILLYFLSEPLLWKKATHFVALLLVLLLSFAVGNASSNVGLWQRALWIVSFGWLIILYNPTEKRR